MEFLQVKILIIESMILRYYVISLSTSLSTRTEINAMVEQVGE